MSYLRCCAGPRACVGCFMHLLISRLTPFAHFIAFYLSYTISTCPSYQRLRAGSIEYQNGFERNVKRGRLQQV